MPPRPLHPDTLRAAKLSRVPGVTIADACARFPGVTAAAVSRARKRIETRPTLAELALAALTRNGSERSGELGELAHLASYLDYVNHDGCTAAEARALLDACPQLSIRGTRWQLVAPWP